jgi:hypothetical protein
VRPGVPDARLCIRIKTLTTATFPFQRAAPTAA